MPVLAPLGTAARADRVVVERDIDFDRRIAAAIENLSSVNLNDHAHGKSPFFRGHCHRVRRKGFHPGTGRILRFAQNDFD